MNPPGVGDYQTGARQKPCERSVRHRPSEDDVLNCGDLALERGADPGIHMGRDDEDRVLMHCGERSHRMADPRHRLAPRLTTMGGDDDDRSSARVRCLEPLVAKGAARFSREQQRINDGIARDDDVVPGDAFSH